MSTILVTGTSRGIGLEIVRQLLARPDSEVKLVLAVTRDNKSEALTKLVQGSKERAVNIVIPSITDEKVTREALPNIEEALAGRPLDILVNNAGASNWDGEGIAKVSASSFTELHDVNVGSVQAMTSTLLALLQKGQRKQVTNISTPLGSLAMSDQYLYAPTFGYKTSKAALNMLTKLWAHAYEQEGFNIFLLAPGWLKTDIGTEYADLDVETGVKSVVEIILSADKSSNGRFRNVHVAGYENVEGPNKYDGKDIAW